MTAADRTLAGLVVALVVSAPLVRPVWRAIDPGPADFLRACESLRAGFDVDPWGTPWLNHRIDDPSLVRSAGPDQRKGTADDLVLNVTEAHDQPAVASLFAGRPKTPVEARAWSYRFSPGVPVALALILLATRWTFGGPSPGGVPPGTSLAVRVVQASGLAIVPTIVTHQVLRVHGAWDLLFAALPVGVLSPALAARGSVYLLFVFAIFAHREFHHSQTEGDGGGATS